MKKIGLLLSFLTLFTSLTYAANEGHSISLTAPMLKNRDVYIAGYFNGKIYSRDTIHLNANGKGNVQKLDKLDEGLYIVFVGQNNRYYEFLVADNQHLNLTIGDTTKPITECFQVKGDPQSEAFIELGKFMTSCQLKHKELKDKENNKEELEALNTSVQRYQDSLRSQYRGKMLGVFANAIVDPRYPKELISDDTSRAVQLKRYEFAKDHFFDNYNLSDPRSWRINMLRPRLDTYLNRILIQIPDSITPAALDLIERSRGDSITFNLMTNYIINYSVTCKIMGMDMLFAKITERYYLTHLAYWADSTLQANVESEYKKVRFNQLGMNAANLPLKQLEDPGRKWLKPNGSFSLYDVNSPLTLLYFYEPSCGHCQATTPKVHDIYKRWHDKGFEVVAVYLLTDPKEWTDFVKKDSLQDWINAWDPERKSYYWYYFDTSTTPGLYLLDKNKKIIAKKIDAPTLEHIVRYKLVDEPAGRPFKAKLETSDHEMPIDIGNVDK